MRTSPRAFIVFSPPGAGRRTQSRYLERDLGLTRISSGEILQAEATRGTVLARVLADRVDRGDLVPSGVLIDLVLAAIERAIAATGGYVLDGFPRTIDQALALARIGKDRRYPDYVVLYLTAPDDVLTRRLLLRGEQEGRTADDGEAIARRLQIFHSETLPIVEHYRRQGRLVEIDASREEHEVRESIARSISLISDETDCDVKSTWSLPRGVGSRALDKRP